MLEDHSQPYVLAVRSNQHLRFLTQEGLIQSDTAYLAEELEAGDQRGATWTRVEDDLGVPPNGTKRVQTGKQHDACSGRAHNAGKPPAHRKAHMRRS